MTLEQVASTPEGRKRLQLLLTEIGWFGKEMGNDGVVLPTERKIFSALNPKKGQP